MIAGHAALLAMKSRRPVKIIYDRMEDMTATTKRHPSRTRHRTAVTREGRILGGEIEFTIDGGAYQTLSPVVLSRGAIHAGGPYLWPSIRSRAAALATNAPPHGAFRGFGAPQSIFAMERHMDHIAGKLGISPVEIRRRNFLKPGDTTTTGQTVGSDAELNKLLDRALELAEYDSKQKRFALRSSRNLKLLAGRGKALESPLSCTAQALPAQASVILVPSLPWKVMQTAVYASSFRARNSVRARIRFCVRLWPRASGCA
jgi:CO/xanthine dehydrogenase Mo-binding subunit